MIQRLSIIFVLILVLVGVLSIGRADNQPRAVSYWLWAGITAEDAPSNSELYVYQGSIYTDNGGSSYNRLGLYPYPLKCTKLFLVYRLDGQLPEAGFIVDQFLKNAAWWHSHPVSVSGLQLDFDSPTSKLAAYSNFLSEVRRLLPQNYALSVTGLGDWVFGGDEDALHSISSSVDEIVFQLYQGRQTLPYFDDYASKLKEYPRPFRIGLLYGAPTSSSVRTLEANPNYRGVIYFIQKDKLK